MVLENYLKRKCKQSLLYLFTHLPKELNTKLPNKRKEEVNRTIAQICFMKTYFAAELYFVLHFILNYLPWFFILLFFYYFCILFTRKNAFL